MARRAKPWWWSQVGEWCVTIRGKRHRLGKEKKAAYDEFHRLMGSPRKPVASDMVVAVLDDFLTYCYENRAKRTADRYKDFCKSFCDKHGSIRVSNLTTAHVTAWLNGKSIWNSTTKRNAITALQRGFNWAVKNRGLDRNPIRGMEKPEAKRRTQVLSPEEFEELLGHVKAGPFRDLLVLSYDSGARPQEIKNLEARHVELDKQRAVLPSSEGKGGFTRAIYFPTDRSMKILKRLLRERPTGALLLNSRGKKWTAFSVKNRLEKLDDVLGKRVNHYSLRHSFVTRKLLAGVDSHLVASLAGHRDTSMIHKVYSHVAEDHQFMLNAAKTDIKPKKTRKAIRKRPASKRGMQT